MLTVLEAEHAALGCSSMQVGLDDADDLCENARTEKPGSEWAGRVFSQEREALKRGPCLGGQVTQLPVDLVTHGVGAIRRCQTGSLRGVCRRTESMSAHVSDARCLRGCPGGCHSGRSSHGFRGATRDEAATDLPGGIELAAGKGPSSSDRIPRTRICGLFGFEQRQYSFRAVRCPGGDDSAIGLTQCLRRSHQGPTG